MSRCLGALPDLTNQREQLMRRQSEPNAFEKARNKLPFAIRPTRLFASGNDSKQLRRRKISRVFRRGPLVILRSSASRGPTAGDANGVRDPQACRAEGRLGSCSWEHGTQQGWCWKRPRCVRGTHGLAARLRRSCERRERTGGSLVPGDKG